MAEKGKKSVRVDRSLVAVPRGRTRRKRVRRFVERAGKGVLMVAGAGAIVALLANLDDLKNSKEVKEHWWLLPLGVIAIGYLLRKRGNTYANAVLAVGGALFASAYASQSKQAQAAPQIPPPSPKPVKGGGGAGGGAGPEVKGPVMPRLFFPPGSNTGWVQMPNGEFIQIPTKACSA